LKYARSVLLEPIGLAEAQITVDLAELRVTCGDLAFGFEMDDYARWRLMEGLDDIGLTLRHEGDITAYEQTRSALLPVAG
jgi:3-isopropylmalate/(R)-2-methylmalate dehydratase small subunit